MNILKRIWDSSLAVDAMTPKNILITGGAGFLGSHLVTCVLQRTSWNVTVLDNYTYAAMQGRRLDVLQEIYKNRLLCYKVDLAETDFAKKLDTVLATPDYVVHMAAETDVYSSMLDGSACVRSNVLGTFNMLEHTRRYWPAARFLYFSTDEVFGDAPPDCKFDEWARYNCSNPYAATKAAGEELTLAFGSSYGLNMVITHCMNAFGERQHPEKFIPLATGKILAGEELTIFADLQRAQPSSRGWIYARDVAKAALFVLAQPGTQLKYNIPGIHADCVEIATAIAATLQLPLHYKLVDFRNLRPGHDLNYGLSGNRMAALGWKAPTELAANLKKTVQWYERNVTWLKP